MRFCKFFLTIASLVFLFTVTIANAEKRVLSSEVKDVVTNERGTYYPMSTKSVLGLLWKYDLYSVDDFQALSQLILANNCEAYLEYIHDDFAWNRILESKKREINYFENSVSDRFVLADVIRLSRYDFEKNLFYLNSQYVLNNAGILDLYDMHNFEWPYCPLDRHSKITDYPVSYTVKISNPLSIEAFPITPQEAETLIRDFQKENNLTREMYSRIYIRIWGVGESKLKTGVSSHVQFKGQVERFELYSDIEAKNLVYEKSFR